MIKGRSQGHAVRNAVVVLAGVAVAGFASGTATAKSSITFSAGPRTVHVGGQIHLRGSGDNDDYYFKRFCIQERTGHHAWRNLRCANGGTGTGGSLDMRIKATRKGTYQFRGALFETVDGRRPEPGPVSGVYTVIVR